MKTMLEMHDEVVLEAKALGVPEDVTQKIIASYQKNFIHSLVKNGYALMTEDMRVEVVPIQRRKYVLKGKHYSSTRVYKVKATIGDPIYNKIRDKFDLFRDDLEEGDYS